MVVHPLQPNDTVGPYRIESRLAVGGMGRLYLAKRGDTRVVLKLLRDTVAEDEEFRAMFFHEARLGALLEHPSIARVVDSGELEGTPYMAVEFIDGPSLSQLMTRLGEMGPAEAIEVVVSVADALQHAHEATDEKGRLLEIVHRDVTPQNILVQRDGHVKLIDFGVARSVAQEHRTRTGVLKGKLSYMAPEQFRGHNTHRSDIFSLAVILWELLAGRRLFRRPTEAEVFSAILVDPVPSADLGGELDRVLQPILDRALERDPERRYQMAGELAADLRRAAGELGFSSGPRELAKLVELSEEEQTVRRAVELDTSNWTEISVELELDGEELTAATVRGRTPTSLPEGTGDPSPPEPTEPPRRKGLAVAAILALVGLSVVGALAFSADDPPAPSATELDEAPEPVDEPSPGPAEPVELERPEPLQPAMESAEAPAVVAGTMNQEATTAMRRGARRSATMSRMAEATAMEEGVGLLYLQTAPWSTVRIGNRTLGQTPVVGAEVPAGIHTLRLTDADGEEHRVRVRIQPGRSTKRTIRLR